MSTTELVKSDPTELARQDEPQNVLSVILRAAADPTIDVSKLQALVEMQFKIEARQAEVEFNAALARLMPQLPRIEKGGIILNKDKTSVRSRYAKFEDIDAAIRPLLAEEGFSIAFDTDDSVPRMLRVTGTLSHRMGHSRKSQITLPTEHSQIVGAQAVGAAASFGKRYTVINLLNIITVGEDTDGVDLKPIDKDQAMTIETMLKDTKADVPRFLKWLGVERVEDILASDFERAVKGLEAKGRKA